MQRLRHRFSAWHAWTTLALWVAFSSLTLLIVSQGLDDAADKPFNVAMTTLGTILGPMIGAISRRFQDCCLAFSLSLLPYCLGALLIGIAIQCAVPTNRPWLIPVRVIAWVGGLLVWLGGGIVSFGHALS